VNGTCRAQRPAVPSPSNAAAEAESAYRGFINAYNGRDASGYFGFFVDPIECYYNKASVYVSEIRKSRSYQFDKGGNRLVSSSISVVGPPNNYEVTLRERGELHKGTGPVVAFEKIVVLKNVNGSWRLAQEVSSDAHKCRPDLVF
jgi:hypothetical protein